MYNSITIFLLSLSLFSCQTDNASSESRTQQGSSKNKISFFNLKGFFDNEIKTKLKNHKMVKKTVSINNKVETKNIEIMDWHEELMPFFNADINKPAWLDKYQLVERPFGSNGKVRTYQTTEKNLKTKQLSIIQNDSTKEFKINILTSDKTAMTQSDTQLLYDTNAGYMISTQQKLMGTTETVVIKIEFLKSLY
jgi:hypothetical protein